MANELIVRLRIGGVDEVERGLRTVTQAAERSEQQTKKRYDNESRAAVKAEREKLRARQRSEREEIRIREAGYRQNAKVSSEEVKAVDKAEREKTRIRDRAEKDTERRMQAAYRLAERLVHQEVQAVERGEREKQRIRERSARAIGSRYGNAVGSGVGNFVHGAVRLAGTAAMLTGGFSVADVIQKRFEAERNAAQLVNAVTSSGAAPAGANVKSILAQASGIAVENGMSKADVISGSLAYSRSARGGNFSGAMANMGFFAKMSKVTGTSIEELGAAAGTLQSQNAELGNNPELMRQMLLNAYAQTKSGSVALPEAAKQIGLLGSTRGFYQGNEAQNQMTLMGIGQIAAAGGSEDSIGTYVKNLSMQGAKNRMHTAKSVGLGGKGLEELGVKYDKTGHMESPEQMIGAVFKATGGDIGKIGQIFRARALPVFTELSKSFSAAGGGDKGVAAVKQQIAGVTQSTMTTEDLEKQHAQVMNTLPERFGKASEKVTEIIENMLVPYLEKFADKFPEWEPKIQSFIDAIGRGIDFLLNNPWEAVFAILGVEIAASVAKAAIGDAVRAALTKSISAGGGTSLSILAAGAVAITAEKAWIDASTKEDHDAQVASAMLLPAAASAIGNLKADASPENIKKAQAIMAQIQGAEGHIGDKSAFGHIAGAFQSKEESDKETAENTRKLKFLMDSVDKLKAALDLATKAAAAHGATGGPNAPNRNQSLSAPARGGTQ